MGKQKTYTPQELERAVNKYFKSITRVVTVKEPVPTGEKDKYGHEIYKMVPVVNALGKEMTVTEYIVPPSVIDLSLFLGIHRSTWANYCNDPAYFDTTSWARGRMEAYLSRENLTRPGKDTKGVQFELENNYGYKQKVEVSGGGVEEYLRKLEEAGKEARSF